jgi:hypothetical protein
MDEYKGISKGNIKITVSEKQAKKNREMHDRMCSWFEFEMERIKNIRPEAREKIKVEIIDNTIKLDWDDGFEPTAEEIMESVNHAFYK